MTYRYGWQRRMDVEIQQAYARTGSVIAVMVKFGIDYARFKRATDPDMA